jgi:hypothetical protein
MNRIIKRSVLLIIIAASTLVAVKPASANILQDLGVGVGSNVISGKILDNGSAIGNTVSGAATGAVVNATHKKSDKKIIGVLKDSAVGAATNVVTNAIINNGHTGKNAIAGAADGALVNILK